MASRDQNRNMSWILGKVDLNSVIIGARIILDSKLGQDRVERADICADRFMTFDSKFDLVILVFVPDIQGITTAVGQRHSTQAVERRKKVIRAWTTRLVWI